MSKSDIMEWYKSNKNGLHFYFYRLCKYCKCNNIEINKDNYSFRDFVDLVYYYSSGKKSNSKFDVINGFKPKYRNFTKLMRKYKKINNSENENISEDENISENENNSDDENISEDSIELEGVFQLEKRNGKVSMINTNKLCNIYMDKEELYKRAREKVLEIEKNDKYMRIMPQWIQVQVEYEIA